jgi:hypothetical protein
VFEKVAPTLQRFGGFVKLGVTDNDYPTDLTDAAWALLVPLLPAARPGGRPRTTDIRAVVALHHKRIFRTFGATQSFPVEANISD